MGIVAKIQLPNLENLALSYQVDIDRVEQVAVESLQDLCRIAEEEMRAGLKRHEAETGNGVKSLQLHIEHIPNGIVCQLGSFMTGGSRSEEGYFHAFFQEYGSPTTVKDPWFRPAADKLKKDWKKAVRKALDEMGKGAKT